MSYVVAGYSITFVVIAGYTWRTLRRGKQLTKGGRRWE